MTTAAAQPAPIRPDWKATTAAIVGTAAVVMAATILNVALAPLMGVFAVDQPTIQWLVTGFLAAMTTAMLISAWSVERFGIRATYLGAMAMFVVGSVMGALAPGIGWLIAARVLQGAAAGVIQPLGMIVVFHAFPPGQQGRGFGLYGLGVILSPAAAPVLGGVLMDLVSWRATFLAALPFCLMGMVLARAHLPGRRPSETLPRPLDGVGVVLLAGTLAVLLWALSRGLQIGWTAPAVQGGLAAGTVGLAAFLGWEARCAAPLLNLRVFRSGVFVGGFLLTVGVGGGLYASTYLLPLYLQQVLGMTPSAAGLVMLPAGLGMAAAFPFAGHLADRVSRVVPIVGGGLLFAVSCGLLAVAGTEPAVAWLVVWTLLGRVGLGFMMPSATAGALVQLDRKDVPQASGAMNFGRQLGGSLCVSLVSIVFTAAAGTHGDGFALLDAAGQRLALAHGYEVAFAVLSAGMLLALTALRLLRRPAA